MQGTNGSDQETFADPLILQRTVSLETERWDYVVVNQDEPRLRINSERAPGDAIYGVLPDFTIIEVDIGVIFWWRCTDGQEYEPMDPESAAQQSGSRKPATTNNPEAGPSEPAASAIGTAGEPPEESNDTTKSTEKKHGEKRKNGLPPERTRKSRVRSTAIESF